jgi:dihydrofolate reductase
MLEIKDTTMRKLIFFMHITLDGYIAGPKGEMDWINLPDDAKLLANGRRKT